MRRILALAALLTAAPLAVAHSQPATQPATQPAAQPKPMTAAEADARVQAELDKIRKRLTLKPEQQTQLRTLLRAAIQKMDSIDSKAYYEMLAVSDDYRGQMRAVLDAKQQAEWDKIKAEYRERFVARERKRRGTTP